MKSLEHNKPAVVALLVFAAAIIIYNHFFAGAGGAAAGVTAESIGNDVVSLNGELDKVDLSSSVFTMPAYRSLSSYSPTLPTEDHGRTNPFAPIDGVYGPH